MKSFNDEVVATINLNKNDTQLLEALNTLVKKHGASASQDIFQLLADTHLETEQAVACWDDFYQHAHAMSEGLGRAINLVTAMCDFLVSSKQLISTPKLTSIEHFNSLVNDSTYDCLTGLLNRNHFHERLANLLAIAKRQKTDLSLLFLDLDDFKNINDTYGHQIGDRVLTEVAALVGNAVRLSDIALRYGGEEFVIIMPNTSCNDAFILGNRIREQVKNYVFKTDKNNIELTLSGGISAYPTHTTEANQLIYYADSAVYRAKGAGKNNISLFKDENRRFLRIPLCEQVQIRSLGFSNSSTFLGMSKDIGIGGILFQSCQTYQIGSQLQISIKISKLEPTLLLGNVVRVELVQDKLYDIGVALSFDDMEKLAKNRISQLLANTVIPS